MLQARRERLAPPAFRAHRALPELPVPRDRKARKASVKPAHRVYREFKAFKEKSDPQVHKVRSEYKGRKENKEFRA